MPHVIVKMLEGRSDAQKADIAERVTQAVMAGALCPETAVSVRIEDIARDRWDADVYVPDIGPHLDTLHKKPGYGPG